MKIGIITIQKCDNFGSDLQAFALQHKLQMLGYEAENIDYLFYKNPRHIKTQMSRPIFHMNLKNRVKEFLYPKKQRLMQLLHPKEYSNRCAKFKQFVENNIVLSREYRTIDDLFQAPPVYDAYMVGSDEVWNPRCNSSMLPFFLNFAPAGAKRLAYAASTGGHEMYDEATRDIFKKYLGKFDRISMRESASCDYFAQLLGHSVEYVVDPTLLLTADEWDSVMTPMPIDKPYILVYDLIMSSQHWTVARRLAAKHDLKIVRICGSVGMKEIPDVIQYSEIGPSEFISLISHASGVLTNSFHGIVFSILYQKPFYFIIPNHMTDSGRIGSLLHALGLEKKMLWERDAYQIKELLPINYNEPLRKLSEMRRKSVAFLEQSLMF